MRWLLIVLLPFFAVVAAVVSCSGESAPFFALDGGGTDSESLGDGGPGDDAGADTDGDSDADTDSGTGTGGDADTDSDSATAGTDTEATDDTAPGSCEIVGCPDEATVCQPATGECLPAILFGSGFEAGNGGMTGTPPWSWGAWTGDQPPGAATHGKVWAVTLGGGDYDNCQNGLLSTPDLDLTAYGGLTVRVRVDLWFSYETRDNWGEVAYTDGLAVQVWDGGSWIVPNSDGFDWSGTIASPEGTPDCPSTPVGAGLQALGAANGAWTTYELTVDRPTYPADFKVRFAHATDSLGTDRGAFLDNLQIHAE